MTSNMLQTSSLDNLDNNCLMKLLEQLPIADLCTMAGVCHRFRSLARSTFKRCHAKNIIFGNPIENMASITRIIKCFGGLMKSIVIEGSVVWDLNFSILKLLNEYCGAKLKKLRLTFFHFDKSSTTVMKTLAASLTTIELLYCTVDADQHGVNYNVAFKSVENLKEFVVIGGTADISLRFLNQQWPALKKVELCSVQLTDESVLAQMLKKNRDIQYFGYFPMTSRLNQQPWVQSFDGFTPKLEDLSIELNQKISSATYVQLLSGLTNLRRIAINYNGYKKPIYKIIETISKYKTLEVVSFWNIDFCQFLTIPEIKNIKTLELRGINSIFDRCPLVNELIKHWNMVEHLYLDHSVIRSANDMELFVENIDQVKHLYLCDMKTFSLMPDQKQFNSWCSKRSETLHIHVDSRYMMGQQMSDESQLIVFHAIESRIKQTVNVLYSTNS